MKTTRMIPWLLATPFLLMLAGCKTQPYDYTNFQAHPPRSILVLPPLNESTDVRATYGYLSMVTLPAAERGYYVFPVAVIDQVMKENGLPTAWEMQEVPLEKIDKVIGADAVLYLTVKDYGTKYRIVESATVVEAEGKLVDVKTGILLWQGKGRGQLSSSAGCNNALAMLIAAIINQIASSTTDQAHQLSWAVNYRMLTIKDRGLLPGPYLPPTDEEPQNNFLARRL
jgi:hypothetical protein